MPTNSLTDSKCKAAKPREKAYKLFDGHGLFLHVMPTGGRVWRMAYRVDSKPQTATFGAYPLVSLVDARAERDKVRARLLAGEPAKESVMPKRQRMLLRAACETYWAGRKDVSESYRANAMRALERHVYPQLGDDFIDTVDRARLLPVLTAIDAKGLHEYVRKVRIWLGVVFEWAVENEHAKINPCALINPEKAFVKEPVEHFAAIELSEVPAFMQRLDLEGVIQSAVACRLLALLWTRTQELRMMEWTEIDWDAELWRIPAGKMKRRKDHLVPLPRQAVALLRHMQARSNGSKYVFPSDRSLERPMSENAVLYLIHRMGYKGKMTGHGFRTVASTWANEQGFNKDAIERQLSHTPDDKVRAAYNRAEYLPERSTIMQAWADWLMPDPKKARPSRSRPSRASSGTSSDSSGSAARLAQGSRRAGS